MESNLPEEWEPSSRIGSDLLFFKDGIELTGRARTFLLDKIRFPCNPQNCIDPHTHAHTHACMHAHAHTHTYTQVGVTCLLPSSRNKVYVTSDEVNSITGKKLVIFEERKKNGGKKLNLSGMEILWGQSKCLHLSYI